MHRVLVEEKKWLSEDRFLHALNFCMLLPGPEAQQLAIYVGWLLHGTRGGLVAGALFIVPGFLVMLGLSIAYVAWHGHAVIAGVFLGLKAAVIALVIEALLRIARRALRDTLSRTVALAAFAAIAWLHVPFPAVMIVAALIGAVASRQDAPVAGLLEPAARETGTPGHRRVAKLLSVGLSLWFLPVALAALLPGAHRVFADIGVFFSKMAVVTFGGAYAALSYVAQQAVERFAWLSPVQMVDGLALAETTPGPLILVLQFVGFIAAYQSMSADHALWSGVLGAALTVWVTFVPCFLWIFLGAPYVERLRQQPAWAGALSVVAAAVVGVIASLALWFALHVLFARVYRWQIAGVLDVELPTLGSLQIAPALIGAVALVMLLALKRGLGATLAICALLGMLARLSY